MKNMDQDKKFVGGKNCFVLPAEIGKWKAQTEIPQDLILEVVRAASKR